MDVTIRKQSMVRPVVPTPERILWNSSVDLTTARIHVQSVYFYKNDGSADFFNHEKLAEALGRTLVPFYPMAGRMKLGERGRIDIDCNAQGSLLVEAKTSAAIADLGEFAPDPWFRQLVPQVDYSQGISSFPLQVIQVTFFRCGGVSLGVGQHHYVADGLSGIHCINSWSEMARGVTLTVQPFIDRTLLKANSPPAPKFSHIEYEDPPKLLKREAGNGVGNGNGDVEGASHTNENGHGVNGSHATNGRHGEDGDGSSVNDGTHHGSGIANGDGVSNGGRGETDNCNGEQKDAQLKLTKDFYRVKEEDISMAVRVFKFTKQQLARLKQMAVEAKTDVTFSSYEMLSGHIWKCATQARNLEPSQEVKLFIATDARSRLVPPLPEGYFGNGIFTCTPMATAGELVRNPVTYGARKIHDALAKMNDEYMRSAIDHLELEVDLSQHVRGPRHFNSPNLAITSWARLPVYDCDFGWGKPVFMGPCVIAYEGLSYILPSPVQDGSLSLSLGLRADHMAAFAELIPIT